MYIFLLGTAVFLLSMTETAIFETILFEALSAMGTVGLSMGLTGELSELGKLIIIALMFAGRVGFVTLGIAAATRDDDGILTDDEAFVI
jgi:trk system potassium uptake protein TrkH